MKKMFQGWMIDNTATDHVERCEFREFGQDELPDDGVLVEVDYTSMNYKDAAAFTGAAKILRVDRCIPGIDLAGHVVASASGGFKEGDAVVAIGNGLGESRHGGMAEYVRVPADELSPLPDGMSTYQAMCFGTAGFTAGMSMQALLDHGLERGADVLVTSVGGGVGSISAALVKDFGFNLHAVTRAERHDYADKFKPSSLISREEFRDAAGKVLDKATWDAGIDTAGGPILAVLLSQLKPNAMATCCGVTAGAQVSTTVMPFILRGITLKGINSVQMSGKDRTRIWNMLSEHLGVLDTVKVTEVKLPDATKAAEELIHARSLGRFVIKVKNFHK